MAGRIPFNPNDPYDPNAPAMFDAGGLWPLGQSDRRRDGIIFNDKYQPMRFTDEQIKTVRNQEALRDVLQHVDHTLYTLQNFYRTPPSDTDSLPSVTPEGVIAYNTLYSKVLQGGRRRRKTNRRRRRRIKSRKL